MTMTMTLTIRRRIRTMTMSKKHFIMLADYIKEFASQGEPFTDKAD